MYIFIQLKRLQTSFVDKEIRCLKEVRVIEMEREREVVRSKRGKRKTERREREREGGKKEESDRKKR